MRYLLAPAMIALAMSPGHGAEVVGTLPIIAVARSASPEFFADTAVRLVEAGKIADLSTQVKLLEDAFTAAAGAQAPVRLIAVPGTPPDTRALYRGKAGELRLDAVSLQNRILKAMVTVDRAKARELFARISRPALEPQPCEDPLVPEASAYYEIAGAIAESTFSAGEKEKGLHVQFLAAVLSGMQSPNELAPFARAIRSVNLKPAEWELLLGAFAAKMEAIRNDFRPFAMSIDELRTEMERLSARAVVPLAPAFRAYLVNQLNAPRCKDDAGDFNPTVDWFNSSFRGALPPIAEDEIKAPERKGALKAEPYFESEDSKRLGDELTRLRNGASRDMFADFLSGFAAWKPSGTSLDVFHQRATVYRALLQLMPPGEDRDRIVELCVTFLATSEAEKQSPAEWLWEARALVEIAPEMIRSFRNSGDAGLVLFRER